MRKNIEASGGGKGQVESFEEKTARLRLRAEEEAKRRKLQELGEWAGKIGANLTNLGTDREAHGLALANGMSESELDQLKELSLKFADCMTGHRVNKVGS